MFCVADLSNIDYKYDSDSISISFNDSDGNTDLELANNVCCLEICAIYGSVGMHSLTSSYILTDSENGQFFDELKKMREKLKIN